MYRSIIVLHTRVKVVQKYIVLHTRRVKVNIMNYDNCCSDRDDLLVVGPDEDKLGGLLGVGAEVDLSHEVAEVAGVQAVLGGCRQQTQHKNTDNTGGTWWLNWQSVSLEIQWTP